MAKRREWLVLSSLVLAACGPDTVVAETSAGSTTEVSGSASASESGSGSEAETGDGDQGLCGGWSLWVEFTGSAQTPSDCDDFLFTGSLVQQVEPGTWEVDACPCNADCESPDVYTLTQKFYGMGQPEFPTMPMCPEIEVHRDDQCYVEAIIVRDLEHGSAPVWWAASEGLGVEDIAWFKTQIFGEQLCSDGDDDGPIVVGHAMRFMVDGNGAVELSPGESAVLEDTPLGPIMIHNGNASSISGEDDITTLGHLIVVQP